MASLEETRAYATERLATAEPHSPAEMFLRLLLHSADAREAGNYGIAAAYAVRSNGYELVCFGESTLFSAADPGGHAEMNALRLAGQLARDSRSGEGRATPGQRPVLVREAPHRGFETILYSTLEPCPMCTVAILNAGVQRVVVGVPDEAAGALLRLHTLAPLWADLASRRGLEVSTLEDELGAEDPGLEALLSEVFFEHKAPLDERLVTRGVLPQDPLAQLAARSGRVEPR